MGRVRYRVVVSGELGPRYAHAFEGMKLRVRDGTSEITGIVDHAQLRSVLNRVDDLGLTLLSVRTSSGPG
jgi:hypothetical protein